MKEYASEFYHSTTWQKCRAAYISSVGGLCEDCLKSGKIKAGLVVHHIKPITPENITDPNITLSFKNLRLVCQDCHAKEHHPTGQRYTFGPNGEIITE